MTICVNAEAEARFVVVTDVDAVAAENSEKGDRDETAEKQISIRFCFNYNRILIPQWSSIVSTPDYNARKRAGFCFSKEGGC
jgi:hypothetical protein